jgi:hypothetical protein
MEFCDKINQLCTIINPYLTEGNNMKKTIISILGILVVVLLLLQVLPISQRTNPPVVAEPAWDSPATRALAKRACFDCHSNESIWPWYAYVAPVKWLVVHDVDEGRQVFNFSDWHSSDKSGEDAAEEIESGGMPLPIYLSMHPEARLSEAEKQQLITGLLATMK